MPKWCSDGRDGCRFPTKFECLVKSVNSHPVHTGSKWSTKTGKYPPLAIPRRCWPGEWYLLVFSTLECQPSLPPPSDTSFLQILHQFGKLVVRLCLVGSFLCMKKTVFSCVICFSARIEKHPQPKLLFAWRTPIFVGLSSIRHLLTAGTGTHSKQSCSTISNHNSWLI